MQIYERLYRSPCALNTTQGTAAVWCTDVEKDLPLGERRQIDNFFTQNTNRAQLFCQMENIVYFCNVKLLEQMTAKVANITKQISDYLASQPVWGAWLFGSYARGEQRKDSDIDILVDFDPTVGLFKYAAIYTDLKELLDCEVDLVHDGALKPYATADRDKILIYERPTA